MKHQMTLDGFSCVKTKQRYEIHIYFEFYCVSLYACYSMGFKAQLVMILNLLTTKLSNFSQLQKILFSTGL